MLKSDDVLCEKCELFLFQINNLCLKLILAVKVDVFVFSVCNWIEGWTRRLSWKKKKMLVWIFRRYAFNVFPDRSELVLEYYDLEGIILSWKRFSFRWKMVKTKFAHGGFDLPSQINLTFTP